MLSYLLLFLKSCIFFTGSYSVNVFPNALSKKEEEDCLNKMSMGDKEARSKLIEHNLRLVAHIVKKFEHKNVDQDDSENTPKGQGLDLDEIHQMNIMNNIIKGLDNIIYNQKIIINLLQNGNKSQKLGRFKVEKYNPNMSITEFKKLFDKK